MAHHKSSGSKGRGGGKSHGSSSSSKKQYIEFQVWYCDHCRQGPYNPEIVVFCTNPGCGHQYCGNCTVEIVRQRVDH
ncbi:hypothetical protein CABS01_12921 [Colletotrichum abscissum]|uniref:Uncharacterized protein n=2 Tax=Colletotrichum acutatum species complex TaxID=2707335 RepID=A0AAI9YPU9_9PEZI|nr:uncharacterized protein CCOS01_11711 [Colletotrichum costaricense]XP_060382972.1 uncharacterized protein CTAM01_06216 [Colletotrichum tamarilloi]XP_060395418.1 uncharacterized protein CABS01_12921 [Colletotrichum abscissum]KAK1720622.1 hypothetical protein BDP67DRAFT_573408 [Colletotrichum lupini]KAK1487442.1 hypothetical protein CABS01_12921 [Colletotrichum abscissum]KAK1500764.1 hypothetical protein CTAM01_06216 [Colletotrichum tamarilloi]KAK1518891.1 hypothetical protein CCOS01_11711 [C